MIGLATACAPTAPSGSKPSDAAKPAETARPAEAQKPAAAAPVPTPLPTTVPPTVAPTVVTKAGPTGKLNIMMGTEPNSLDFHVNTSGRIQLTDNIFEALVTRDQDMKLVPALATSWERIDPTRMRFKLQQGVKFHNGEKMTADAVALAITRINDPEMKSTLTGFIEGVKEAVPVDDYTVDMVTHGPDPLLLQRMVALPVLAPDAIRKDPKSAITKPIGTGPYRLVEWLQGQHIRLQAFDEYWGPLKPPFKDVDITSRKEASVRMTALRAGEVHLIDNISPEDAKTLPQDQVVTARASETLSIRMNVKTGITTDKRVRQAMAYAIDRESIVRDIYQGFGQMPHGQVFNDLTLGFDPDMKDYPYDLDKAKQLVKEAGAEGAEIMLTGATANRWLKDREIQEAVAAMINKTGLKVNLRLMELTEAYNYFYEIEKPVAQGSFTSPSSDLLDADRVLANYSKTGARVSLYSNPELDAMFAAERAELDNEKRAVILRQMSRHVYEEIPVLPICQPYWIYGVSPKLTFRAYPTGQIPIFRMAMKP
jgi:peptide/nickel transport system substrate-binding protein